jgi:hypothetical protein
MMNASLASVLALGEVGDAAHRQARQIGHLVTRAGDRDRYASIVAGWLTTTSSVPCWSSLSNKTQSGFAVGQGPVMQPLPRYGETCPVRVAVSLSAVPRCHQIR